MTLNSNSSIELWEDAAASQPQLYSPLTLAFLGDGVFELLAREQIVKKGSMPVAKLHLKAVELVRADAQAALYEALLPLLSQEELEVLRRGRNANGSASAQKRRSHCLSQGDGSGSPVRLSLPLPPIPAAP